MRKSSIFALALTTGLLATAPNAFADPETVTVIPDVTPDQIDGGVSSTAGEGDKITITSTTRVRRNGKIVKVQTTKERQLTSAEKTNLIEDHTTPLSESAYAKVLDGKHPTTGVPAKVAAFFHHLKKNPLDGTPDGSTGGPNPDCVFWYSFIDSVDADGNPLDADGNIIEIPTTPDGDKIIFGTDDNDVLCGDDDASNTNRKEVFIGGAGDDRIEMGDGNDIGYGEEGDDVIYGQSGRDYLSGGEGNDMLFGGREDDELQGKSGDDKLWGGSNSDLLYGSAGSDFLNGGNAAESGKNDWAKDKLDCGNDSDSFVSTLIDQTNKNCESDQGQRNFGPGTEPNGGLLHFFQKAVAAVVSGAFVIACVAPSVIVTGVVLSHLGPHAALPVGVITIPASVAVCGLGGKLIFGVLSR